MFDIKIEGLKEVERNLEKIANNAQKLSGEKEVPLGELISPSFVSRHTKFTNFDELLNAGDFSVRSQEDFDNLDESELDKHISSVSRFGSWREFIEEAGAQYLARKLGL